MQRSGRCVSGYSLLSLARSPLKPLQQKAKAKGETEVDGIGETNEVAC